MNSPKTPEKEKEKAKKVKGPVRWEAVVPVTVICVCAGLYFSFLFDSHLRYLIEFTGTHIHGAEVNVGRVRTSFLGGSFRLSELQITDKEDPSRNIVSIGEIRFGFMWDALLRAKFVVEEASIVDIQAFSPRMRPGKILPVEVSAQDGKSPALAKLESGIIDQTKKEFEGNLLSDLANIIEGTDPTAQIKNLESDLKSNLKIKELETSLKEKQALWDARIKALPRSEELRDFEKRVKAIKVDTKDPVKFAASIGEIQSLVKEADQKIKSVKETSDGVNNDLKSIDTAFKDLDQIIKQDIQDLEKHFKIPQIDVGDFSKKLFGKMFAHKLVTIQKYMTVAREYLPPQKTEEQKQASAEEQIVPRPRSDGKTYRFPITRGYPLFWLKKASISSEPSQSNEYSGRVRGELLDLTSDPAQIAKPTIINFEGDFPKQMLMGLVTKITLDHTTDKPKESMQASIASFPVQPQKFSDSPEVKLILTQAKGSSDLNAVLENEELKITVKNSFADLKYDIEARSKMVHEILTSVTSGIPVITLDASATGNWKKLNLGLRSNLGDEIAKGFKKQLDEKIEQARAKIKALIDEKIAGERAKFTAEVDKVKAQVNKEIEKVNNEVNKAKKDAEDHLTGSKKSAENGQKKRVEEAGKKVIEDLKKKIKFK